jgi:DNA-binding transcriptional ArsR family regulator
MGSGSKMTEKYLNIDIEDPRSGKIAQVLGNKTAKKILSLLAENEMSASEISEKLDLPLNTITYNVEKLVSSGLAEEVKGFLWSVKGKRIKRYKVSNRKIIISPKKMVLKGILPMVLISGVIAGGIKYWMNYNQKFGAALSNAPIADKLMAAAPAAAGSEAVGNAAQVSMLSGVWVWAAAGVLAGIAGYLIWEYVQKRRRNERRLR